MSKWEILRSVFRRPAESCLVYAPWRGCFGVHYTLTTGTAHRWWGYNPITWLIVYRTVRQGELVKAAFLYFRLTKDRPAVVIATHIKNNRGVPYVKGHAQQ